MANYSYGWKRQPRDNRDYIYKSLTLMTILLSSVDLRSRVRLPPAYDQGTLSACTPNGCMFAHQYNRITQGHPEPTMGSRLMNYYDARVVEGTVWQDRGCNIRDSIKVLNTNGACHESTWPYNISAVYTRPSQRCYNEGAQHKTTAYYAVSPDITSIKTALCDGFPVVFGFDVYESFTRDDVKKSGVMPVPNRQLEQPISGHCVVAVGYNDNAYGGALLVRNSWGTDWGLGGYFWMPYSIIYKQMAADFWVLKL